MEVAGRKVPSPIFATKDNPAADPRQMRRIIAEDPDWSLATVPLLTELCVKHIVQNFEDNPVLDELLPKHKFKVLEALSTEIAMKVTAGLVSDEGYWKRCCKARWEVCDINKNGNSWKRMYFERNLEGLIENFVPETTDQSLLNETLKLSAPYVRGLNIKQLLPPVKEALIKDDDTSDAGSDAGQDGPNIDHFDFGLITPSLIHLEELHLTYGVRDCGMNFEWNLFQFTARDCLLLAKAVKACHTLKVFHLHRSGVDDEKVRVLISHVLDHPSLLTLDLSHNKIEDSGARAVGKLLNGRCNLTTLNLCDNKIRSIGAAAIGHALGKNTTLTCINLRLNRLGDDGGQAICRSLFKNNTLTHVHLGSNDLGEPTAAILSQVLAANKTLVDINLSCNTIGPDGGKSLQEGMEENTTIQTMDLRLTEVGQENEYCINQLLKRNREEKYRQSQTS
ncbi:dynein regulatory complex subunit 5-like [Pocillopora verrucosa]|uniref:dynein regulatory complex subunit 5-like n=1 Tax=Pocillopora verrucosa TaxID=203993 RepID=UPI002797948C|nr:dynein regulatory complex subunit 5-like [Pocillopora verrucosa]